MRPPQAHSQYQFTACLTHLSCAVWRARNHRSNAMSHRIVTFLTASVSLTALACNAVGQAPAADPLASGGAATQQGGAPQGPESSAGPRDSGVPIFRLQLGDGPQAPGQGGQAPNAPSVAPEVNVKLGGWMRVEYGYGNRFGPAAGRDELGISKAALV